MSENIEKLKGEVHLPLKTMLQRIWVYMKPEMPKFIFALFLIAVNIAWDVVCPLFIGEITNNLKSDSINLHYIVVIAVSYLAISIVSQAVLYCESMLLQHIGQRVILRLRTQVFEHIENMSQNQFDEMPVGSLVTRVASYTTSMSDLFTNIFVEVLRNILTVIGVYGIMLYISWQLALIMLGFIAIVFATSFVFGKIVGKIFREERKNVSDLNTFLNENLSGMKLIQVFNRQKFKELQFIQGVNRIRHLSPVYYFAVYAVYCGYLLSRHSVWPKPRTYRCILPVSVKILQPDTEPCG